MRLLDLFISAFLLIAAAPILMLISTAIYFIDGEEVIFKQKRVGYKGKHFFILKFKTMSRNDNQRALQAHQELHRISKFGMFLRKYHLDELPQLINVLRGDMSLVGPRPHEHIQDQEFEKSIEEYAKRRNVKPGMTGWAQVNLAHGPIKSHADIKKRTAFDIEWARHSSVGFYLVVLIRTIVMLLKNIVNAKVKDNA